MSGSVTLPPARKAPRAKEALQQSLSSTPRFMCSASVSSGSMPKARNTAAVFSGSVMRKRRLPCASGSGCSSKPRPKARRNSRGSNEANSPLAVTRRISLGLKVLQ